MTLSVVTGGVANDEWVYVCCRQIVVVSGSSWQNRRELGHVQSPSLGVVIIMTWALDLNDSIPADLA